ncbi:serine/threonine-protein kinase ksp1 [Pseudohyphozyma bogoriensis]|nr:serine/threonine-protein kinase ksp1 [Pseudohyphozyma bogoriensis]
MRVEVDFWGNPRPEAHQAQARQQNLDNEPHARERFEAERSVLQYLNQDTSDRKLRVVQFASAGGAQPSLPYPYFITEYVDFTLAQLQDYCLQNFGRILPEIFRNLLWQLVVAVEYVHSRHVVHHDINPRNIFIKAHFRAGFFLKLGDFGAAYRGLYPLAPGQFPDPLQTPLPMSDVWKTGFEALGCVVLSIPPPNSYK